MMYELSGTGGYMMDDTAVELLKMLLGKLHDIEDRQVSNCEAIAAIQTTLDNGLKRKVDDLAVDLKELCKGFDERLQVVEEFAWFRHGVTQMRDNWFKYSVAFFVAATALMIGVSAGSDLFRGIMKMFIGAMMKG